MITAGTAFITPAVNAAVSPHLSISPTTGTLGVTNFTESYSGFSPNRTITENVTYPNGGLTVYHLTADGNGNTSVSFVLQSQSGNYSSYAVDDATGVHSNTITYTVNPNVNPHLSITPTTGTLGVTNFTESYSGFTRNGTITENVTYPNGGLTVYHLTADGNGNTSVSFVLQSQSGNYSSYAVDDATAVHSNTITYKVNPNVNPHLSISPTTGTLGVTNFTESYSGFTHNGTITENVTYPNGGLTVYHLTADGNGNTSVSFVLQSQSGNYSSYAVDDMTGVHSNTITYTVNPNVNPHLSISPTTGTLGVTNFTESYSGFTHNGTITENVTYPNGGLTVYHITADSNGSANISFVLRSQSGNYSAYAVDDATGTHSNTVTYTVNSVVNPHISITPTTGTLSTTSFTESYNGFTRNGTITENVTYPNGGLTVYHVTADGNGNATASFVLLSQSGSYSSYAVDDGTGVHSNTIGYTVNGTARSTPIVNSISPTTPVTRNTDQDVAVYGSNFQQNLTVSVNFPSGSGTTLSGSQITNVTSSSFLMHITLNGTGTWSIRVNNPDGGQSSAFSLSVINASAVPTISAVQQPATANSFIDTTGTASLVATSTIQNVTVTGKNFQPALSVDALLPTGQTITLQGPSQILNLNQTSFTVGIPLTYSGTYSIRVKNPDGGQSNSYAFPISGSGTCSVQLPKRFSQVYSDPGEGWEQDWYDHFDCSTTSKCHISNWGCYMTSLAMALRYNGIDTDPRRLNNFMKANSGYDTRKDTLGGVQNLPQIVSSLSGGALTYQQPSRSSDVQRIKDTLCNGFPLIVGVMPKTVCNKDGKCHVEYQHFVLVTGINGNTFDIADPLQRPTETRTLDYYFQKSKVNYPNNWFQTRGYVAPANATPKIQSDFSFNSEALSTLNENSSLSLSVGNDAELLIIDPQGRRTGLDPITATDVEEIPNSGYFRDSISDGDTGEPGTHSTHSLILSQPTSGIYKLVVTGQDSAVSNVSITFLTGDGGIQQIASILSVTQVGSTATYQISVAAAPTNTLQLALDQSGPALDQVAAVDPALFVRDPFPVVSASNLFNPASDRNTRIIVFALNLQLSQGETPSGVVVSLVDSNNQTYDVPAEDVRSVPNSDFAQVTFRLPTSLATGTCSIKIKAHNQTSNSGTIRIKN